MRLADYLDQHEKTLTSFAAEIGTKVTTLHGWVSGRRRPKVGAVAAIERVTGGAVRAADFIQHQPVQECQPPKAA